MKYINLDLSNLNLDGFSLEIEESSFNELMNSLINSSLMSNAILREANKKDIEKLYNDDFKNMNQEEILSYIEEKKNYIVLQYALEFIREPEEYPLYLSDDTTNTENDDNNNEEDNNKEDNEDNNKEDNKLNNEIKTIIKVEPNE